MEKKDWKKKLRELSFMKGYYFKLEDNGLVEKKDDQLVFNREELERFIEVELSKAREEGRFTQWELEYIRELAKEDRLFTRNVVEYNTDTRLIKKISELLKDNK